LVMRVERLFALLPQSEAGWWRVAVDVIVPWSRDRVIRTVVATSFGHQSTVRSR
jgi:hypothetical protein